jgi:phage protein U
MKIHVNDIDLFYRKAGSGQSFILMHGKGENHGSYIIHSSKLFDIIKDFV